MLVKYLNILDNFSDLVEHDGVIKSWNDWRRPLFSLSQNFGGIEIVYKMSFFKPTE